eukprot:gene9656-biopygen6133
MREQGEPPVTRYALAHPVHSPVHAQCYAITARMTCATLAKGDSTVYTQTPLRMVHGHVRRQCRARYRGMPWHPTVHAQRYVITARITCAALARGDP